MNNPDYSMWLLAAVGLLVLAAFVDLLRHGPRKVCAGVLDGFRWLGLLVLGVILSVLGVASLLVFLCVALSAIVLLVVLLVLVLVFCAWMVPVMVLGAILMVGCMELLP